MITLFCIILQKGSFIFDHFFIRSKKHLIKYEQNITTLYRLYGGQNIFLVTNLILLGGPLARMLRGIKNSKSRLRATLKHHQKFQSQPNIPQNFQSDHQTENEPGYFDVPDSFTLAIQNDPIYPEWTGSQPTRCSLYTGFVSRD